MINKLKSIYFYLLYKVNKLKSAKIVCLEMVRLLCSEIWVFAFVGWRYVPSPPVLSRVNNNVMLIICHTVQHKIDFYLWNFKSTIRRMCLFMFWCWACHKTESTDLPFEYDHVCHGVLRTPAWLSFRKIRRVIIVRKDTKLYTLVSSKPQVNRQGRRHIRFNSGKYLSSSQ